jgi:transposase
MYKKGLHYVGLDVHKKTISLCVQNRLGKVIEEKTIPAVPDVLINWAKNEAPPKWKGGFEATVFSSWIYDTLKPYAKEILMGNPRRLKSISQAKHKSDKLDAWTLCSLLRADFFPECYVLPSHIRRLRNLLRYRNFLVWALVSFKNRIACLLMSAGVQYNKSRLHGNRYYHHLINQENLPEDFKELMRLMRLPVDFLRAQTLLVLRKLERHPELKERMKLLQSIPGIGPITALTWILEIWDPARFPTAKHAHSYCGLCSGRRESGGKEIFLPISKQRNAYMQWILIEAAKVAKNRSPRLLALYEKEKAKGHPNDATFAVARKLVIYLLAIDTSQKPYVEPCMEKTIKSGSLKYFKCKTTRKIETGIKRKRR